MNMLTMGSVVFQLVYTSLLPSNMLLKDLFNNKHPSAVLTCSSVDPNKDNRNNVKHVTVQNEIIISTIHCIYTCTYMYVCTCMYMYICTYI